MIYSATGVPELDRELQIYLGAEPLFYRQALLETCETGDTVIVGPNLKGENDLDDIIRQLREKDIRVIFLAGDNLSYVQRYVQYGVYDIILGSEVTYQDIVRLYHNPATYASIARFVSATYLGKPVEEEPEKEGSKPGLFDLLKTKLKKKENKKDARPLAVKNPEIIAKTNPVSELPVVEAKTEPEARETPVIKTELVQEPVPKFTTPQNLEPVELQAPLLQPAEEITAEQNNQETDWDAEIERLEKEINQLESWVESRQEPGELTKIKAKPAVSKPSFFSRLFSRNNLGYVTDNGFVPAEWKSYQDVSVPDSTRAIIIPDSWEEGAIKNLRRNPYLKTSLIVTVGKKSLLHAGADKSVPKLTPEVTEDLIRIGQRLEKLWQETETDMLTGVYTRKFFLRWLEEQKKIKNVFSVVMIDLDHFKKINDTYGHDAGDAVLAAFGEFLRNNTRSIDVCARLGGEEFAVGLVSMPGDKAHVTIDRLRAKWQSMTIFHAGQQIRMTFSAGISDHTASDPLKKADEQLYEAKQTRNTVKSFTGNGVLLLAEDPHIRKVITKLSLKTVADPAQASCVILADMPRMPLPRTTTIIVADGIKAWAIKNKHPEYMAVTPHQLEDTLRKIFNIPKLQVLPGTRQSSRGLSLQRHSVIYFVCPSRPGMAGEIVAEIASSMRSVAVVCASSLSTAVLALGVPRENLVGADWRIPNSSAPIDWAGIKIWPVDPALYQLTFDYPVNKLVESIRNHFDLIFVDCASDLSVCSKATAKDAVIVIHREGDSADVLAESWLEQFPFKNTFVLSPSEIPQLFAVENGFVLQKSTG